MNLGQEDCPPSTFGAANLMFLAAIQSTEKWVALSSHMQPNYLLKKSVNLEILWQMIQLFRQPWYCLYLNLSRNRVDVEWNLVSCERDANRTNIAYFFSISWNKVFNWTRIINCTFARNSGKWLELLFTSITVLASKQEVFSSYIILHRLEWRHWIG